jgi:hypothetical protein
MPRPDIFVASEEAAIASSSLSFPVGLVDRSRQTAALCKRVRPAALVIQPGGHYRLPLLQSGVEAKARTSMRRA